MANDTRALYCLLDEEERSSIFKVCVFTNDDVADLQEAVKKEKKDLRPYDTDSLILWRVSRR